MAVRRSGAGTKIERALWDGGADVVVGIDEVGKGAWAGPLTVAAAVLPTGPTFRGGASGIRDSKQLSEVRREALFEPIAGWCRAWAVGHASPEECDRLGMSDAQRLAARRALDGLGLVPDAVLVDGRWDFVRGLVAPSTVVRTIVKGDAASRSIAAASVLAKVTRDRIMREAAAHHPPFWFESNKGYPCPRHREALQGYGPSAIHRRSWVFMDDLVWTGLHRPLDLSDAAEQLSLLDDVVDATVGVG